MGNNEKTTKSSADRNPMESFEPTIPSEPSSPRSGKVDGVEGTKLSDPKVETSEQTESQQDTNEKVLDEKSPTSGQTFPKKKKFPIKTVAFLLIVALGSAVYFLIMERKQDLNRIQNQLARLDAQIQTLQTPQKEPSLSLQSPQALRTRLQELESKVKQLARQTPENPTSPIEETPSKKVHVGAGPPQSPDAMEPEKETVPQEAPDHKANASDSTEHMDTPKGGSETPEEKLETVDLEKATSAAEVESSDDIAGKKSREVALPAGMTNEEPKQTAPSEEPIEAIQAPKTQENPDTRNEVGTAEKEKSEMTVPSQIEPKSTLLEKPVEITPVSESKRESHAIETHSNSTQEASTSGAEASQSLNAGAKRYVEFVESMAEKAYQLVQKVLDASLNFLREVAR